MSQKSETEKNNGRNPLLILGGFILLGLAIGLLLFGGSLFGRKEETAVNLPQVPAPSNSLQAGEISSSGPLAVGDVAYDFTLQDLDGNSVSLSDLHGRPVILNFWATWCGPCRIEMPELQADYEARQDDGLVILALDQQEQADIVREFFYGQMGLTFTPLLDSEGAVSDSYGANRVLPTTFFINPAGEVTAIHRGPMTRSQIDGYLAETIPTG